MERYGLDFSDESDEQATAIPGRTALCVSINGAKTAKLTVKYTLEPLFEVLVERLAEEQIYCAVETQDPLIHSAMAADLRTRGRTPISVVHKSAKEMRTGVRGDGDVRREPTGILARRSRLHLAEIAIFCKRLRKIRRGITSATLIAGTVFFFAAAVVMFLGLGEWIDQYVLLLCHGVTAGLSVLLGLLHLPRKDHISLASYDREQETR